MKITQAEFVISSTTFSQCPKADRPEYALIGRSNVGKSSLINALTGRKKLAKISGSPGKTILINHFLINREWYLVDLPGYGFAKRSKTERAKWQKMIRNYILNRRNLMALFLLVDLRLPPQQIDMEFVEWLGISQIPFVIVFTKADKLKNMQAANKLKAYRERLLENWEELPEMIVTSSKTGSGKEEMLAYVERTNTFFKNKAG
ncbi:MAG: ribosome biogenesis GTP-binding protein YihA/YsxC [Bacteroidales bacterium]|nr:ribosome biogenesis GTP-binding protein YihA/YsxC [Bacteroidales bacterium]MCF6341628.1 ribosome biogenesis GTP-binding protein YihA/YsxC [Bacteroidales bacterium]